MDKKELIFPGVILGIVLIAAIGLIITQGGEKPPLSTADTASSTASTTQAAGGGDKSSSGTNGAMGSTGSGAHAPQYYYPYGKVTLALSQAAGFRNGASLRPLQVLEDSRCPAGVMCIQAGTVKMTLRAKGGSSSTNLTMSLGEKNTFDGLVITFVSVAPIHAQSGAPAASAYRFTFTVEPVGSGTTATSPCYVGGCSSELCSDTKGQISNCMYTAKYACYRGASCERQSTGACGWTQTPELTRCLVNAGQSS